MAIDTNNNKTVHASVYDFPVEGRPDCAHEANEHLSDLRAAEKLLPVLHAGLVVWAADCRA